MPTTTPPDPDDIDAVFDDLDEDDDDADENDADAEDTVPANILPFIAGRTPR